MKSILIVSDSRGKLLKPMLTPPPGYTIDFEAKGGATLNEAKNIVARKLANSKYTCVYILAGICSVTNKDEGLISLPFDTHEDLVDGITREINNILTELDDSHTTPIVLCTFPGVDLIRANNKAATGHHPQQDLLNSAMIDIADYTADLNLTRGFSTPMLSAAVHRCHGKKRDGTKKYKHHYCRLDDGVHPTDSTLLEKAPGGKFWTIHF